MVVIFFGRMYNCYTCHSLNIFIYALLVSVPFCHQNILFRIRSNHHTVATMNVLTQYNIIFLSIYPSLYMIDDLDYYTFPYFNIITRFCSLLPQKHFSGSVTTFLLWNLRSFQPL